MNLQVDVAGVRYPVETGFEGQAKLGMHRVGVGRDASEEFFNAVGSAAVAAAHGIVPRRRGQENPCLGLSWP